MNRSKRSLPKKVTKEMNKEIHKAQMGPPTLLSEQLSYEQMLTKYPKKIATKEKSLIATMKNQIKIKKNKKNHKESKRTTPSMMPLDTESTPKSPHIEGKRWIKTEVRQSVTQGKRLTKNLSKKK